MADPEIADVLIRAGQGQTGSLRVREESGVEVQPAVVRLGELDPSLEVTRLNGVAVNDLARLGNGIVGVNIDLVGTGNQGQSLVQIGKDLIRRAGQTGVVTGCLDTAGQSAGALEAVDIVCLPAVHGNAGVLEFCQGCLGINTELCVHLFGGLIACVHGEPPVFLLQI